MAEFAGDRQAWRRELYRSLLPLEFHADTAADRNALQALQEINVEVGSSELPVRYTLQANVFLLLDDIGDCPVFCCS